MTELIIGTFYVLLSSIAFFMNKIDLGSFLIIIVLCSLFIEKGKR